MEACFKETTKYIKLYIPTGKTGNSNPGCGIEMKKVIFNKENNEITTTTTFIRNDEKDKFLSKLKQEELKDEIYPIYAKALLQFSG